MNKDVHTVALSLSNEWHNHIETQIEDTFSVKPFDFCIFITEHFSGTIEQSIQSVCLCVQTITFEVNNPNLDNWHFYAI